MENKETSLWDLCLRFFNWLVDVFKKCLSFLGAMLQLSVRKWWIVAPVVILLFAFFIYMARPTNKWYSVSAMAMLNGPTTEMTMEVMAPLVKAHNPHFPSPYNMQSLLGITDSMAMDNIHFKTYYAVDCMNDSTFDYVDFSGSGSMTDTMYMRMRDYMGFGFATHNLKTVREFTDSVLSFVNNNPLMQNAYLAYKKNLELESRFCEEQIKRLDSLTLEFYFHQGIGDVQTQYNRATTSFLVGKREVKLLHNEILQLIDHKAQVDHKLSLCTAPVVVPSGFTINNKADNGLLKYGIYGLILGYLIGCLLAALIENWSALWHWLTRKA
ncbi:MAG: hypothetical protein IJS05_04745 [Paludibacteraceae bacterium]|nr:hypothetical protein [Paludibacteraceae bacterium]